MKGPLSGVRLVEMAAVGPGPFAGMMLADAGADVIVIDRVDLTERERERRKHEPMFRGRRSIAIDAQCSDGRDAILRIVGRSDGLIEGFRPGVMERLGLGPEECMRKNPRLVYGRMTGWGQDGPLASSAGHDINFIGLSGVLNAIGRSDGPPVPPLNLIGDFGGGGMLLAFGMSCALFESRRSGKGQVIDAAMVDGTALLSTFVHGLREMGYWTEERGANLVDTGAHFYDTYETADGKYVAVGAIEPQFYAELLDTLGMTPSMLPSKMDRHRWPDAKRQLAAVFRTKTRDQWCTIFDGKDACVSPVLSFEEAIDHPHNVERRTFVATTGSCQPAPAPRFARTPGDVSRPPPGSGEHTGEVLEEHGFGSSEIEHLRRANVVR